MIWPLTSSVTSFCTLEPHWPYRAFTVLFPLLCMLSPSGLCMPVSLSFLKPQFKSLFFKDVFHDQSTTSPMKSSLPPNPVFFFINSLSLSTVMFIFLLYCLLCPHSSLTYELHEIRDLFILVPSEPRRLSVQ